MEKYHAVKDAESLHTLSLRELHELLNNRGIEVSYSSLSALLAYEGMGELLEVSGGKNLKRFPLKSADILLDFWPVFQEAGGRKPNAVAILRRVLERGSWVRGSGELITGGAASLVPRTSELAAQERYTLALEKHTAALEALPAPEDELLSVKDAAARYGVSPSVLREMRVKDGGRLKVKRSDVLKYIAGL